ncbi:MAG: TadE/TadG family type IV pilus assembly protein [Vulcanimicrobiaceae bacterium]
MEIALLAPFLLLMLVGLTDIGRYTYFAIEVNNAARAGVQYGSQNQVTALDSTGVTTAARNDAPNLPAPLTVAASYSCKCADGSVADCHSTTNCATSHELVYVQVQTSETFPATIRFPGLPATLTVNGNALMQVQ